MNFDYILNDGLRIPISSGPGLELEYVIGDRILINETAIPDGIYQEELGSFVIFKSMIVACFLKSSSVPITDPIIRSLSESEYKKRMSSPKLCAVFAGIETEKGIGIGYSNLLPWPHLKEDMDNFKNLTSCKTSVYSPYFPVSYKRHSLEPRDPFVIMGYKTWESLPLPYKPLPGRGCIVLTSKSVDEVVKDIDSVSRDRVLVMNSIEEIVRFMLKSESLENREFFLIGGKTLYDQFLDNDLVSTVYYTKVTPPQGGVTPEMDTYIDPAKLEKFRQVHVGSKVSKNGWGLDFKALLS